MPRWRPLRHSLGRITLLLGYAALAWLLLWPGAGTVLLVGLGAALDASERPQAADAIITLGGDAETRPFTAADLYRAGWAPQVILFTHAPDAAVTWGVEQTEDALYRTVLQAEGVPETAIRTLPQVVDSTADEAHALRSICTGSQHWLVVTSREHTWRAARLLRQVLAGCAQVHLIAAQHPHYGPLNWWHSDEWLLRYLHELLKLPYYRVRHG